MGLNSMQNLSENTHLKNFSENSDNSLLGKSALEMVVDFVNSLKDQKQIPYFLSALFLTMHLVAPALADKIWEDYKQTNITVHSTEIHAQDDTVSAEVEDNHVHTASEKAYVPEKIEGAQSWVSLLCSYQDIPEHKFPREHYEQLNEQFAAYWKENSYGTMSYDGVVLAGPYILPGTELAYNSSEAQDVMPPLIDCIKAANADIDFTQFDGINAFFSGKLFSHSYGGGVTMTLDGERRRWSVTWLSPHDQMFSTGVHEQGHGFGLKHSFDSKDNEYANPYDNMSRSEGQHISGYNKWKLGWLQAREVQAGQTESLELPVISAESSMIILVSPLDSTIQYSIESRNHGGLDSNIIAPPGVVVHKIIKDVSQDGTETERIKLITDSALQIGDSWKSLDEQPITLCVTGLSGSTYLVTIANGVDIDCSQELFNDLFLPKIDK